MDELINYLQIDYHKLQKHKDKVQACIAENPLTPITLELQPTERCNCNCPHCQSKEKYDQNEREYMIRHGIEMDISLIDKVLDYPPDNIIISGTTGDPLLYSKIDIMLQKINSKGIPVTIITNGIQLTPYLSKIILDCCYNIRISLDATDDVSYSKTHGVNLETWTMVTQNICHLVELKKERYSDCKIGIGYLTGNKVTRDLIYAVLQSIKWGVNYIDFRPLQSYRKQAISSQLLEYLSELKKQYEDENFYIWTSHQKYSTLTALKRRYNMCLASYLYALIAPDGNMYLCCNRVEDKHACYGNMYNVENWNELLKSPLKKKIIRNLQSCPNACRLHTYNTILSDIISGNNQEFFLDLNELSNKKRGVWDAI